MSLSQPLQAVLPAYAWRAGAKSSVRYTQAPVSGEENHPPVAEPRVSRRFTDLEGGEPLTGTFVTPAVVVDPASAVLAHSWGSPPGLRPYGPLRCFGSANRHSPNGRSGGRSGIARLPAAGELLPVETELDPRQTLRDQRAGRFNVVTSGMG